MTRSEGPSVANCFEDLQNSNLRRRSKKSRYACRQSRRRVHSARNHRMPRRRTAATKRPTEVSAGKKSDTRVDFVWMIAIAALTLAAFVPLIANQFVNWDDPYTITENQRLSSPGILGWAFTTRAMGHLQPITWLTWSAVTSIFGLSPIGFHALSLFGHVVNSALVYLVIRRLLLKASCESRAASSTATATALLFAIHPLRVEPVAWASAFPYIQSLTWLLVATLAYLRYTDADVNKSLWLGASILSYGISLLSRAAALGYPLVLLTLDVVPLRRIGHVSKAERRSRVTWMGALLEKVPFAVAAVLLGVLEAGSRETAALREISFGARLTTAFQAPLLYFARTMVPLPRSPIDPLPISPVFEPAVLALAVTGAAALTGGAGATRRRWPAGTAG